LLKHTVVVDPYASASQKDAARRWLARSWESVHPWGTGGVYVNFPEPGLAGAEQAYYGTNYERLLAVKQRYDPDGFFRFR
jgi:FAD/FMN-containing dehydrogenase